MLNLGTGSPLEIYGRKVEGSRRAKTTHSIGTFVASGITFFSAYKFGVDNDLTKAAVLATIVNSFGAAAMATSFVRSNREYHAIEELAVAYNYNNSPREE